MFLSQLLEEYKSSDGDMELHEEFIDRLWKSKCGFKKNKKYYTYVVNENMLGNRVDLIELFNEYSSIEYTVCKSFYKKGLESVDYIRVHINNMFGLMFDKDVYYDKQYYKCLIIPKREYLSAIKRLKNGEDVDCESVRKVIGDSLTEAENIKQKSINGKGILKWTQYKKLINEKLKLIFNNFIPIHDYEELHGWEMKVNVDGWSEDNYAIRYFNKSLSGYMKDYRREKLGFKKRDRLIKCESCGIFVKLKGNNHRMCDRCWKDYRLTQQREWDRTKRKKSIRHFEFPQIPPLS